MCCTCKVFLFANKPYRFLFCISRRRHRLALHDFIFFWGTTLTLLTRAALLALAKNTSDYKLVYKMLVKPETEGIESKSKLKKQSNRISILVRGGCSMAQNVLVYNCSV